MLGIYAGSFDPLTVGHADVIENAYKLFDHFVIAIGTHASKKPWFPVEDRIKMISDWVRNQSLNDRVEVCSFDGLLIDFVKDNWGWTNMRFVRGLRTEADFVYEMQMAHANMELSNIPTLFIPTTPKFCHVSSTLVRELADKGREYAYSPYVPDEIGWAIDKKMGKLTV